MVNRRRKSCNKHVKKTVHKRPVRKMSTRRRKSSISIDECNYNEDSIRISGFQDFISALMSLNNNNIMEESNEEKIDNMCSDILFKYLFTNIWAYSN